MPESRDRLSRAEDVTAIFARRRRNIRRLNIYIDESAEERFGVTPFRWGTTPMTGVQGPVEAVASVGRAGGGIGRRILGTPRNGIRRGLENIRPSHSRRGRGRGTILPSWYPRVPLRDITDVSRAIERRRESLREMEAPQFATPAPPQNQNIHVPYSEYTPIAQLEHIGSFIKTPYKAAVKKSCVCPPSVAKILLNISNQKVEGGNSECLTPQKKLLNSIDTVGKAVMEELEKLKKTPTAKRAVRDKKIRTLMSMR